MADTGKLGTPDSQLGNLELAYVSAGVIRPLAGTRIGRLGTPDSMLGNVMLDIGIEEGTGATEIEVSAVSTLTLTSTAAIANFSRSVSALSNVSLLAAASAAFNRNVGATSTLAISGEAFASVSRSVAGESVLSLSAIAALYPWTITDVAAESVLDLASTATSRYARFWPVAESVLTFSGAAYSTLADVITVAGVSAIELATEATGRHAHFRPIATSTVDVAVAAEARHAHFRPTAESALDLDVEATSRFARFWPTAQSTIVLDATSNARLSRFWPAAESAIALTQVAHGYKPVVVTTSADSTLDLMDWAIGRHSHFRASGTSALTLADSSRAVGTYIRDAESVLQTTTVNYDPSLDEFVTTIEGLQDSAIAGWSTTRHARSVIPLRQSALGICLLSTAIEVSAANVLELTDQLWNNKIGDAISAISLTQTAVGQRGTPIGSVVQLIDSAGVTVVRKRTVSSVLELKQSVSFTLVRADLAFKYHPFVGEGGAGAPTPPPVTLAGPLSGVTVPFQLVYPATGVVTDSVTLRSPNFGNKDRLSFNRVLRETRGGTLVVYADPIWPKIQTLALSFSGLSSTEAQELIQFFDDHLGQQVGLLDWEHRYWVGIVTNPDDPIVQDGKDSFTASFEFEGVLDPTWVP